MLHYFHSECMIKSGITVAVELSAGTVDALGTVSGAENKYSTRPNGVEIVFLQLMELLMEDSSHIETLV